jgi:protein tyrosine/serine phosphatase
MARLFTLNRILIVLALAALPGASLFAKAKEDLPNFHTVHPFLLRGGEPSAEGLRQLKAKGVTQIIDLRAINKKSKTEKAEATRLGIHYAQLPMSSKAPTKQQVEMFFDLVDHAKKTGECVYVHCQHGSDRTGAMVGIWRVTRDGWTYDRAYKEMRNYYFTPKFAELSGTVREYAEDAKK